MKKKLIAFMLIIGAAAGTTVRAENSIAAHTEDNSVVFEKQEWMKNDDTVVLSFYDKEGNLKYSQICTLENNEFRSDIADALKYARARACFLESGEVYDVELTEEVISSPLPSPSPFATEKPQATPEIKSMEAPGITQEPEPTQTPEPTDAPDASEYPAVYKSAVAAKNAFSVVESVSTSRIDGEDKYLVNVLYQGTQKTLEVDSELTITSASDYFSSLGGQKMTALKKGDVIHFAYNLSKTKIKEINFIYRPVKEEIATSDEDYGAGFARLISKNGLVAGRKAWGVANYSSRIDADYCYAFGIVTDRSGRTITLYPKSGRRRGASYIYVEEDAVIYVCDTEEKNKLEVTGIGGIIKTAIPKRSYDDNENVEFTSEYKYSYALVRLVDGEATDVIVYKGTTD